MSATLESKRRALERKPGDLERHRDLIRVLLRRRRLAEAASEVLRLHKAHPNSPVGRNLAHEVLAGWLEAAALHPGWGPSDDLQPTMIRELEGVWGELERGRVATALATIRRLQIGADREAVAALEFLHSAALERRGRLDDALATLNKVVKISRKRNRIASAMLQKGRILERIRYRDGALQHYQQALHYDRENMIAVSALLRLGEDVEDRLVGKWAELVARLDGRSPFDVLRERLKEDAAVMRNGKRKDR